MCVILICPRKKQPDFETLRACHAANPHGAGVAWRCKRHIYWRKALTPGELNHLISDVTSDVIIHFRWASVGGVEPLLCHPFPISADAALGYEGVSKEVLFHNGTCPGWRDALATTGQLDGPVSDTRVAAAMVHHEGRELLEHLSGRWAVMRSGQIDFFGDWKPWRDFLVSNTHFVPHLVAASGRSSAQSVPASPKRATRRRKPSDQGPAGQLPLSFDHTQN